MKFIIAQVLGVICSILSISVTQFKSLKHILIGEISMNLLFGLNYLLLGGISGTLVCAIATIHAVVVYTNNQKNKAIPLYITSLFIVCYSAVTLIPFLISVFNSNEIITFSFIFKSILPLISSVLFTLAIGQNKTIGYRLIKGSNTIMWLIFDICVQSYGSLFARFLNLASHTVAILRYDVNSKNKN